MPSTTPMSPASRRLLFVLGLMLLGACTTVRPGSGPVAQVRPEDFPPGVRLTLVDGSRVALWRARLERDTITGIGPRDRAVMVAARDVARWEERRVSYLRTAGLVVGAAAVAIVVTLLVEKDDIAVLNPNMDDAP